MSTKATPFRRVCAILDVIAGTLVLSWALAGIASVLFLTAYVLKVLADINVSPDRHLWDFFGL